MGQFLEERLPVNVKVGAEYGDDYNVEITETASWSEHRHLVHPYPRRVFNIGYTDYTADLWDDLIDLYHRAYGMYAGFRVRAIDDFSTNDNVSAPTALDQELEVLTAGSSYRLQKFYGQLGTPLGIGSPVRTIFKPVAGTTKVAIAGVESALNWSVTTTTGVVTFSANITDAITAITKAAQAVITVGSNSFTTGMSVYFSDIVGMVELNGLRGLITARTDTQITVAIDTTLFTTYVSGGNVNTNPQTGELVTGGCEFDIPCRFNGRIDVTTPSANIREANSIEIIELLNP